MCGCEKECWECAMKLEAARFAEDEASESEHWVAEGQAARWMADYPTHAYMLGVLACKGMSAAQMVVLPELPSEFLRETYGILLGWCKTVYMRDIIMVSERVEVSAFKWAAQHNIDLM